MTDALFQVRSNAMTTLARRVYRKSPQFRRNMRQTERKKPVIRDRQTRLKFHQSVAIASKTYESAVNNKSPTTYVEATGF
jgi:hypothetical protein